MFTLRPSSLTPRLCSRIHYSAVQHKSRTSKHKGPSKTRLVQDLRPRSSAGKYEIAQEDRALVRSGAPHQDPEFLDRYNDRLRRRPAPRIPRRDDAHRSRDSLFAPQQKPPPPLPKNTDWPHIVPPPRVKPLQRFLEEAPESEFYHPPSPVSLSPNLPEGEAAAVAKSKFGNLQSFSSPPLLPGFIPGLSNMLGPDARPTPIQALSIKWLIEEPVTEMSKTKWNQFLLASETGSGKSLAYLLPVLQKLKLAEESDSYAPPSNSKFAFNPRAIILAPTHELARQLTSFAKALTHEVKLRVLCVSRANTPSTAKSDVTAKKLSEQLDALVDEDNSLGEMDLRKDKFPVDILIGTPVKIMELVRGRGWDRLKGDLQVDDEGKPPKLRRGRDKMPGVGSWRAKPALGLQNVEWVVVDEADVLFDPDFQEVTRTLLADMSAARGKPMEVSTTNSFLSSFTPVTPSPTPTSTPPEPIDYPFNLILTSATIPKNLASYLDHHHPELIRLASPRLHLLPKSLKTEYTSWTGGNKFADIEHRIREAWSSDAAACSMVDPGTPPNLSKILIFCNRSLSVTSLSEYLEGKEIKCVALTSTSDQRKRGSNKHLDGFLRPVQINPDSNRELSTTKRKETEIDKATLHDPKVTPHVMITTSLLSRGLDFSPDLGYVFVVDEPRNMVDFLHRAGRSGRAGRKGKVVVFTKMKGRGSSKSRDVLDRLRELVRK